MLLQLRSLATSFETNNTMKFIRRLFGQASRYPTHSPNPQPHPALQHLQITFHPDEYVRILQSWKNSEPPEGYREKLPTYIMARCPFCSAEYKTKLDTHSLKNSYAVAPNPGYQLGRPVVERCAHFLAIHAFINLNGLFPEEKSRYFDNDYDVPFISPLFLPDEVPSYGIIHSLPICRLEDNQFIPRYYLYSITYYVPENYVSWVTFPSVRQEYRRGIIHERRMLEAKANDLHWEEFLYFPSQARRHPE